jgi:hypothetical protein
MASRKAQSWRHDVGWSVRNHTVIGRAVRRAARTDAAYAHLPDCTWMEGGCWLLARALGVALSTGDPWVAMAKGVPQHFALRVQHDGRDLFLDGDGAATAEEFLWKMSVVEGVAVDALLPASGYSVEDFREHGLDDFADQIVPLAETLRSLLEGCGVID